MPISEHLQPLARPVSYTHLDVYKRQALTEVDPVLESSEDGHPYNYFYHCDGYLQPDAEAAVRERYPDPVSYTHLDVYKRQGYGPSGCPKR